MALKAHPRRYQPGAVRAGDRGHLHLVLAAGVALVAASALLVADAVVNTRAFFDLRLMRAIQAIDVPYPGLVLRPVDALTSSVGAVSAWALVLLALLAARWWVPTSTVFVLPLAGALDNAIGWFIVERQRPTLDEVLRVRPGTDPSSFPSGHVLGAVVLYGLLFVIAERIGSRWARRTLKALCVWVIALVGVARVWYGAHWPTDVLGAYAMGGVLLLGLLALYNWVERIGGVGASLRATGNRQD